MNEHAADWEQVGRLLREARACVAPSGSSHEVAARDVAPLTGTLGEFEEFLDHNELELAWDALAVVAERAQAPYPCWQKLSVAAAQMRLPEKARAAAARAVPPVPCEQALAVARN